MICAVCEPAPESRQRSAALSTHPRCRPCMHSPNHTNYHQDTICVFTRALVEFVPCPVACALTRLSAPPPERCGDNREQSFNNYDSLSTLYDSRVYTH